MMTLQNIFEKRCFFEMISLKAEIINLNIHCGTEIVVPSRIGTLTGFAIKF